MATTRFSPEHWAIMKDGLFDWARSEVSTTIPVIWGQYDAPSPDSRPFVVLNVVTGPIPEGQHDRYKNLPAIEIRTVANSTLYTVSVDGVPYTYTSDAGARVTEIRDGLIAALNLGSLVPVAAVASATGLMWIGDDQALVLGDANTVEKIAQMWLGDAVYTFAVDVIADRPDAVDSASEAVQIAAELMMSLGTEPAMEILQAAGWSVVQVTGIRHPAQLAGSGWEDRSGFDVRLRCRTRRTKVIDFIEGTAEPIAGTLTA